MIAATGTGGGQQTTFGYGLNLNWQFQKAYLTASYQSFINNTSNGTTATAASNTNPGLAAGTTTFVPGYNGGAMTAGTNSQDIQQYYAGSYDFGAVKLFAGYVNRKATAVFNPDLYILFLDQGPLLATDAICDCLRQGHIIQIQGCLTTFVPGMCKEL